LARLLDVCCQIFSIANAGAEVRKMPNNGKDEKMRSCPCKHNISQFAPLHANENLISGQKRKSLEHGSADDLVQVFAGLETDHIPGRDGEFLTIFRVPASTGRAFHHGKTPEAGDGHFAPLGQSCGNRLEKTADNPVRGGLADVVGIRNGGDKVCFVHVRSSLSFSVLFVQIQITKREDPEKVNIKLPILYEKNT
jgi:hypothetical protein